MQAIVSWHANTFYAKPTRNESRNRRAVASDAWVARRWIGCACPLDVTIRTNEQVGVWAQAEVRPPPWTTPASASS